MTILPFDVVTFARLLRWINQRKIRIDSWNRIGFNIFFNIFIFFNSQLETLA